MRQTLVLAVALSTLACVSAGSAQVTGGLNPDADDVYVRVVDIGPGLCTITEIPGPYYMVYDAGHWVGGRCLEAVREIVDGEEIDLFIVSHSDGDHLGDAAEILEEYFVYQIIRTGYSRRTRSWEAMNDAVGQQVKSGASVMNLQTVNLTPGEQIVLGDAVVTLVAGWGEWEGDGLSTSEERNVISIVVRLEYAGHSILYGGDTVGRRIGDPDNACKDAELFMVDNVQDVPLDSDVMIAPHHGADNGSSQCFIQAVDPDFVIFSAGHQHGHPRAAAAERYRNHGIQLSNIYRTDLGDDEGGSEWSRGRVADCVDSRGDDDVEIVLPASGSVQVAYRGDGSAC